jgi:hypothetical protein
MPNKTITKFSVFVILVAIVSFVSTACHKSVVGDGEPPSFDRANSPYDEPKIIGKIQSDEITESSGIAASRCQPDLIWTHNDSGDGAFIFAMNPAGKHLGTWEVRNAKNLDWEDMAAFKDTAGKCYLYIGDTGNTNKNERAEHKVYRVAEPVIRPSDSSSTRKAPTQTGPAETLTFSYPDARQDAETLMVHPVSGEIYVITKNRSRPAAVYKLKPIFDAPAVKADKVSDITVPAIPNGFLTDGGISPDGRRVIICDYFAAYEFKLPDGSANFDDVWKQKPAVVELGDRKQGETVGYSADGLSIIATSEGKFAPIIEAKRRK